MHILKTFIPTNLQLNLNIQTDHDVLYTRLFATGQFPDLTLAKCPAAKCNRPPIPTFKHIFIF